MFYEKKHRLYIFKHEKSRTVYIRMLSTNFKEPEPGYLIKPLYEMLRRQIPYCDQLRFKQITKHISEHNLYATGKIIRAGKGVWHEEWSQKLSATYGSRKELDEKFHSACLRYLKKGWFVLNAKDLDSETFLKYFNQEEYRKALLDEAKETKTS